MIDMIEKEQHSNGKHLNQEALKLSQVSYGNGKQIFAPFVANYVIIIYQCQPARRKFDKWHLRPGLPSVKVVNDP